VFGDLNGWVKGLALKRAGARSGRGRNIGPERDIWVAQVPQAGSTNSPVLTWGCARSWPMTGWLTGGGRLRLGIDVLRFRGVDLVYYRARPFRATRRPYNPEQAASEDKQKWMQSAGRAKPGETEAFWCGAYQFTPPEQMGLDRRRRDDVWPDYDTGAGKRRTTELVHSPPAKKRFRGPTLE